MRHRPSNIIHGQSASLFACAHCSIDVCRGMPAQFVACVHRSVIIGCGLCASVRGIHPWIERIGKATFVVACVHWTSDINQRHETISCTYQSWRVCINSTTSIMACAHQLNDIFQCQAKSYMASIYQTWRESIDWATQVVACIYWQGDVDQRHAAMVSTHLTWFLHIYKETKDNDIKLHPRICIHNPWRV